MFSIFLLEDDFNLGATLQEYLTNDEQKCDLFKSCKEAQNAIQNSIYDLYICDVNLPDGNGLNVADDILKKSPSAPILFLSATSDPLLRLQGLEMGAFDFINKPFTLKELQIKINRIKSSITHLRLISSEITLGRLKINFSKFELYDANNNVINMTHKESAILKLLFDNANHVVSRDQILDSVWGKDSFPSQRTIDNYIVNLRKWCETDDQAPISIISIRGIGYKLTKKD